MLSMTKQLVCKLEVLQPQPSTTVPELNYRWKGIAENLGFLPKSAQTKIGWVKSFAVNCAHKCNFRWKLWQLSQFFIATKTCPSYKSCNIYLTGVCSKNKIDFSERLLHRTDHKKVDTSIAFFHTLFFYCMLSFRAFSTFFPFIASFYPFTKLFILFSSFCLIVQNCCII